jgi:hypothetical protein
MTRNASHHRLSKQVASGRSVQVAGAARSASGTAANSALPDDAAVLNNDKRISWHGAHAIDARSPLHLS